MPGNRPASNVAATPSAARAGHAEVRRPVFLPGALSGIAGSGPVGEPVGRRPAAGTCGPPRRPRQWCRRAVQRRPPGSCALAPDVTSPKRLRPVKDTVTDTVTVAVTVWVVAGTRGRRSSPFPSPVSGALPVPPARCARAGPLRCQPARPLPRSGARRGRSSASESHPAWLTEAGCGRFRPPCRVRRHRPPGCRQGG